jgi:HK97 gp10 family phage protein
VIQVDASDWNRMAASFELRGREVFESAKREALSAAFGIERDAKQAAPVDTGRLRSSISTVEMIGATTAGAYGMTSSSANEFTVTVGPNVEYGPYVEFGTRPHWPPIAAILEWVKRKGLGAMRTSKKTGKTYRGRGVAVDAAQKSIAFLIARAISRRGTRPQPYLVPAFLRRLQIFTERLQGIIRRATQGA